jgi:hypothetical protein
MERGRETVSIYKGLQNFTNSFLKEKNKIKKEAFHWVITTILRHSAMEYDESGHRSPHGGSTEDGLNKEKKRSKEKKKEKEKKEHTS